MMSTPLLQIYMAHMVYDMARNLKKTSNTQNAQYVESGLTHPQRKPSCLHTTLASLSSQSVSQTVPQAVPPLDTSSRPYVMPSPLPEAIRTFICWLAETIKMILIN
jgi:hypothetical protein